MIGLSHIHILYHQGIHVDPVCALFIFKFSHYVVELSKTDMVYGIKEAEFNQFLLLIGS